MDPSDLLEKLPEYKKQIVIGSLSVIAGMALIIGYFQIGPDALVYAEAESAYSKWERSHFDENLYESMLEAVRKAPEIEKKYAPTIAQSLVFSGKIADALVLANGSLKKVKADVPYHADYAETSLLIEQRMFQQALEKAVALKVGMGDAGLEKAKGGSFLYLHNLLRIACLQQELKNLHGEIAAWEEFEDFLAQNPKLSSVLMSHFSEAEVTLTEYIANRKQIIEDAL